MMGALHIEQTFLVCQGQLIRGSGLHEILKVNKFALLGTNAIVDVSDIKRARYCVQVAVCAMYGKLKNAVVKDGSSLSPLEWLKSKVNESDMCYYWHLVINMQLQIFLFIRSIREGNFPVYVASIRALIKWLFVFDHYNYSIWLSVHLFDLMTLKHLHPAVYHEMMKGNFSFQKTNSEFSRIATNQVHKQNIKVIKGAGGATQLLNLADDSALIRWETCGPDIARIVSEFEELIDENSVGLNEKKR